MARHPSQIPNLVAQYEPYRQAGYTGRNHKLVDFSGNGHHGDMGSVKGAMLLGADGLSIPGSTDHAASNYTTNPSAAEVDVELDLVLDDVVGPMYLASKADQTGQRSWDIYVFGTVRIRYSTDGTNMTAFGHGLTLASVVAPGERFTLRVQFNGSDNGQRWVKFFINGSQWGPTSSLEGPVTLFNGSTSLKVARATSNALSGRVFSMTVRDGIDGAIVANPDFTAAPIGAASFDDDAGNTWTINSSNYDSNDPTIDSTGANFDGSDYVILDRPLWGGDFTILIALTSTGDEGAFYSEGSDTTDTPYFLLAAGSFGELQILVSGDSGSALIAPTTATPFDGTPCTVAVSVNSATREVRLYVNGVLDRTATHAEDTVSVNISTIGALRRTMLSSYSTATIHAMAQFDRVLTDGEIAHLHDYYRNQGIVALPAGPTEYTKSPRIMLPQHIGHL